MSTPTQAAKPKKPRIIIPGTQYHRIRKAVQAIYFFGAELRISELSIVFQTLMFMWILIAAMAMIYGRFWCGYLCPQMIFSETANGLEKRIIRFVNKQMPNAGTRSRRISAAILYSLKLLPASVFVTFVFVSYFVPPLDLFHRLLSLDMRTAGGIVGASVTLVTFLDFSLLRERFCTAICPYGYLQNMLKDKHTLSVLFHDPKDECIKCSI